LKKVYKKKMDQGASSKGGNKTNTTEAEYEDDSKK